MNLKYTKKFIVNEENNIVICELKLADSTYNYYTKLIENTNKILEANNLKKIDSNVKIPKTFTVKSICHPEDTFDVKFGKQNSKEKAYNKMTKKISDINYYIADALSMIANNLYYYDYSKRNKNNVINEENIDLYFSQEY
jgi:hypothetical protein